MKKKVLFILLVLIVLTSILGISYASWLFTGKQKDFNTLGSKCFELTMINESEGITFDKAYPIRATVASDNIIYNNGTANYSYKKNNPQEVQSLLLLHIYIYKQNIIKRFLFLVLLITIIAI